MKRWMALLLGTLLTLTACAAQAQTLTVEFYDVGKADAMLITAPSGFRMLIDAGTNKAGKTLAARLALEGIEHIDVMLITHFDKDHVGGADRILGALPVDRVILPVYDKESKQHTQFMEALEALEGITTHLMEIQSDMTMQSPDGVELSVTSAHRSSYGADEENDFSLCTRLSYGQTRFLFPGDAEDARTAELLTGGYDLACDVLKVPHHGRFHETSGALLDAAAAHIRAFGEKYPLTIEMGRFFAAPCGTFLTGVADAKCNLGVNYAVCDGGMHQVKYDGQLMGMQVPPLTLLRESADAAEPWMLCGSLCTTADVLVREAQLPPLRVGDVIALGRCGAYSVTEGVAVFLSRDMPRVALYRDGAFTLVRDRFATDVLNTCQTLEDVT